MGPKSLPKMNSGTAIRLRILKKFHWIEDKKAKYGYVSTYDIDTKAAAIKETWKPIQSDTGPSVAIGAAVASRM